ncbi:hypothetical protein ANCDUO_23040 [Ancylostoma duodenale]|uniref:Uncharacterized protein n=1 Tax=Ancylostoma duodenale TaxID=51022 RepID=A0A0C2FPV2_9BILA|nr:hypothetical protein ANCDUO_23040 [Ancylostoma duodenale]
MLCIWWSVHGVEYWELLAEGSTVTADACAPGGGTQPATITLFTDENYDSSQHAYYKSIKSALAKYGINYVDGMATITPRSSFGRVAIDIYASGGMNCDTLPGFVKEMIAGHLRVNGTSIRCGNNPVIFV